MEWAPDPVCGLRWEFVSSKLLQSVWTDRKQIAICENIIIWICSHMLKSVGIDSNGFKHIRICGHIWHYLGTDSKLWLQIVISGNRFEYVGTNTSRTEVQNQNAVTVHFLSTVISYRPFDFARPIHAKHWDRRGWSDYVRLVFTREICPDKRTYLKLVCTMTQCRENNTTSKVFRAHPSHPCSLNVHGCALWHAPVL